MISGVIGQSTTSPTHRDRVEEQNATLRMSRNVTKLPRRGEISKNIAGVAEAAQTTPRPREIAKGRGSTRQMFTELRESSPSSNIEAAEGGCSAPLGHRIETENFGKSSLQQGHQQHNHDAHIASRLDDSVRHSKSVVRCA